MPVEVLNHTDGTIFLSEETPEFIARNLVSRLRNYAATLKTPFFGALVDYSEQGNQLWTCPGHNGGIFYSRSPIGRIFVEHLGPAIFRDDLDNSVLELGDLLTHEGPALAAEKAAAKIFGAERTYFVLNGTSSSNKIVLGALVAPGDLVLFDRNNHKAAHHGALLLGGGVPVYLPTDRNAYGMIGPIDYEALDEDRIRDAIRANPLVQDPEAWQRPRPFRAAVIEQCTYDGTIYDAQLILRAPRQAVRLHPVRRGLGRVHEVPPAVRRAVRHGAGRSWTATSPASSPRNPPTSSSPASPRRRRSTCATATSRARSGGWRRGASTRASWCTPARRRSTRSSPRSTSAPT